MAPKSANKVRDSLTPTGSRKDEDDLADEGSVADQAASLAQVSIQRRRRAGPSEPASQGPGGLISYWERLRGGRRFPSPADLDQKTVSGFTTAGLVMRFVIDGRLILMDKAYTAKTSASARLEDLLASGLQSAIVLDWVRELGRRAARQAKPTHGSHTFPATAGDVRCTALMLPLSKDQPVVDHLLCYLQLETV